MRGGSLYACRVKKRDWYLNGAFANPRCWRRQIRGAWHYYINAR